MRIQFSKLTFTASIMLALTFIFSCSNDDENNNGNEPGGGSPSGCGVDYNYVGGTGCDISGYKFEEIGTQTWMAQNLNCDVAVAVKCYDGKPANCEKYGGLYDWATAMALPPKCNSVLSTSDPDCAIKIPYHRGICPSGWHIPSDADWNVLMKKANPSCSDNSDCANAGTKLKATSGWCSNGNGTDDFKFAALPGGYSNSDGYFLNVGYYGRWWSASEYTANYAYRRYMGYDYENVLWSHKYKGVLLSVRCVKDK